MIGKIILHYEIIEKLGEGGIAVLNFAGNTKLHSKVAIDKKFGLLYPSNLCRPILKDFLKKGG